MRGQQEPSYINTGIVDIQMCCIIKLMLIQKLPLSDSVKLDMLYLILD